MQDLDKRELKSAKINAAVLEISSAVCVFIFFLEDSKIKTVQLIFILVRNLESI